MISKDILSFLQEYSDKKLKITKNLQGSFLDIRENIIDTISKNTKQLPETSLYCYTHSEKPFKIFYSYQRYDLTVKETDWLKFLYNFRELGNKTSGLFLTSGMSSINLILSVLNKLKIDNTLIATKDFYFEVKLLIKNFFEYFKVNEIENLEYDNNGILWIDSSSPKFKDVNYKIDNHKIVIFDTSCLDLNSNEIKKLILKFSKNSFVILIRSHIKLDCFGLEISRLGSAVFVYPTNNEKNFKIGDDIVKSCQELAKLNGGNFEIKNIYPWLGNEEFFELTKKRTEKMVEVCKKMEDYLDEKIDKNRFEIIKEDHKMYFYVKFLFNDTSDSLYKDFYDFGGYLSTKAEKLGLLVRNACSFGLNLVGFDKFDDTFGSGKTHLRITSSPGLSDSDINAICDFLLKELEAYGKN